MATSYDSKKLKKMVATSVEAKRVFQALASRKRSRDVSDLFRVRADTMPFGGISMDALLSVFKELEKNGLGKIDYADDANRTPKFYWKVADHVAIAREMLDLPPRPTIRAQAAAHAAASASFPLSNGLVVHFPVEGVPAEDEQELVRFIKRLVKLSQANAKRAKSTA